MATRTGRPRPSGAASPRPSVVIGSAKTTRSKDHGHRNLLVLLLRLRVPAAAALQGSLHRDRRAGVACGQDQRSPLGLGAPGAGSPAVKAIRRDWVLLVVLAAMGVLGTVRILHAEHPAIEVAAQLAWLSFNVALYWVVTR